MKLKVLIILIITSNCVKSQSASCSYRVDTSYGYTCEMTINNPDGFDNFTQIDGNHLQGYTNDDVRNIERILPSNSSNFPSIICEVFRKSERLFFRTIGLIKIGANLFKSCENLRELDIMMNSIEEIHENAFANLTKLESLYLYANRLTKLHEDTFRTLPNLKTLYLNANSFKTLPSGIYSELRNLQLLYMDRNSFATLNPKWFENLSKLESLNLYSIKLVELPRNVFTPLVNLRRLEVYDNNLTTIHSDSFGIHRSMSAFRFHKNKLDAFDERIIDNTALTFIEPGFNPCVNINTTVNDNSAGRDLIRATLQSCFDNYEERGEKMTTTTVEPTTVTSTLASTTTTSLSTSTTTESNHCESIGSFDERVCRLESTNEEILDEILNLKVSNQEISQIVNGIELEISEVNGELQQQSEFFRIESEELRNKMRILTNDNQLLKEDIEVINNEINTVKSENIEMRAEIQQLKDSNSKIVIENQEIRSENEEMMVMMEIINQQIKALEEQVLEITTSPCACIK